MGLRAMSREASTVGQGSGAERVPRRVLIVEDEAVIARDLAYTLRDSGYTVLGIATSSAEALRLTEALSPDVVLMDIRLPGGPDGIKTAALIREWQPVPIVYLTANADPETLERALATAPGGYLAKPFDSRTLHTTIEVALRRHRGEAAANSAREASDRKTALMRSEIRELSGLITDLRHESTTDALTGLHNRRCFDEALRTELARAVRRDQSVGIILFDVDHFKAHNDEFGHQAGDEVLQGIGNLLCNELRAYDDTAYRYGGEEFVVLAPGSSLRAVTGLAERLRRGVAALRFGRRGSRVPQITASFGVAVFPEHAAEDVVAAADSALYAAKDAGRNRVVAASAARQPAGATAAVDAREAPTTRHGFVAEASSHTARSSSAVPYGRSPFSLPRSPLPMWIFDRAGAIVAANDAATDLYACGRAELLALGVGDLWPDCAPDGTFTRAPTFRDEGGLWTATLRQLRRDGTSFEAEVTVLDVGEAGQGATMVIVHLTPQGAPDAGELR